MDSKIGFIDKTGKEIIPLIYDKAYGFSNGKAEVKMGDKVFFINRDGNDISGAVTVTKPANTPQTAYGTLDYRNKANTLGTGNEKTYLFKSKCRSGNNTFNVISQISADISIHDMDEIKSRALKSIASNGWSIQSELAYLGLEKEVIIPGKVGRDYVISTGSLY